VWKFPAESGPRVRLPAGGYYPPYGHIGHWEVTGKTSEEMGFSIQGINILCDAAQDSDFYDFGKIAAHAQTPDEADFCGGDTEKLKKIIEKAISDHVECVSGQFQRCKSALGEGEIRLSLYWLGYALQSVEDLAVHKGITNGNMLTV
jgi:hypothetical protein